MMRYLAVAGFALALLLGLLVWRQSDRIKSLSADLQLVQENLSTANEKIKQAHQAEVIWKDRLLQMQREARELDAELSTLQNMEGRDAPLSDLLRATGDAADRLR